MAGEKLTAHMQCAVIYARYSSHSQNDTSIEQQVGVCKDYARRNNLKIVEVYADRALTGTVDKRPEFQRMIKDSAKGHFQFVITYKVDRFARNRYDSATYKTRLKKHGVSLLYAMESIPDGPEGILLESILEGSAEYYSANLSQNVRRGMKQAAEQCLGNGGAIAFGYKIGPDRKFVLDPAAAPVVREIFELYNTGVGTKKLSEMLNKRGYRTSKGNPFTINAVTHILKNERYMGVYIFADTKIKGGIPQIISPELFHSVQERIGKMKLNPAANRSDVNYLLTGKLFCGHCKSPMVGASGTSCNGSKYTYYACNDQRKHRCNKKPVRQKWLEQLVARETMHRVLQPAVMERIAEAVVKFQEREREGEIVMSMQRQLNTTNRAISNMLAAIEQGIITETTKDRLLELEKQKGDLQAEIEKAKTANPLLTREEILLLLEQQNQLDLEGVEPYPNSPLTKEQIMYYLETFTGGDFTQEEYQRQIIDVFVHSVLLYDDGKTHKIKIVYNYAGEDNTVTIENVQNCDNPSNLLSRQVFAFDTVRPTIASVLIGLENGNDILKSGTLKTTSLRLVEIGSSLLLLLFSSVSKLPAREVAICWVFRLSRRSYNGF